MSCVALVATMLLAFLLWKIMRCTRKTESTENNSQEENRQSQSGEINSLSSFPGVKSGSQNSESVPLFDQNLNIKSKEQENQDYIRLANAVSSNLGENNDFQKKLYQEVRRRENAENWAEFLAHELEAHIQARTKSEERYKQLVTKLNPESQQILAENVTESSVKTFRSFDEVQNAWTKIQNNHGHSWSKINDESPRDTQHEDAEWNEMVKVNLRFLQVTNLRNTISKTALKKRNNPQHMCQCSYNSRLHENNTGLVLVNNSKNIAVENSSSTEKRNIQEDEKRDKKSQDGCTLDLRNFNHQDKKLTNGTKITKPVNPSVCTDSLDTIKKTTQLWESLSVSKDRASSCNDLLSPSPATDSNDRKSIQESLTDIKSGLVRKNMKLWENS